MVTKTYKFIETETLKNTEMVRKLMTLTETVMYSEVLIERRQKRRPIRWPKWGWGPDRYWDGDVDVYEDDDGDVGCDVTEREAETVPEMVIVTVTETLMVVDIFTMTETINVLVTRCRWWRRDEYRETFFRCSFFLLSFHYNHSYIKNVSLPSSSKYYSMLLKNIKLIYRFDHFFCRLSHINWFVYQ